MSLSALPPELLDEILYNLNVTSLRAIRLTNRALYDRTFGTFANKIAKQRWLLRETSLATLKAAGSHPRLKDRIEKFRLGTHKGQWVEFPTFFCCEKNSKIAVTMERIDREFGDPEDWKDTGTDGIDHGALVIADLIQSLSALRSIGIGELCKPGAVYQIGWLGSEWPRCAGECRGTREVDSQGRDPLEYGIVDEQFELLDMERLENLHAVERQRCTRHWKLSMCLREVLHALTLIRPGPGAQALESLSVGSYDGKKRMVYGAYLNDMDILEENNPLFIALRPVLKSVSELNLAVEIGSYRRGPPRRSVRNPNPEAWLAAFLRLVPRLETLHLHLDGWTQLPWKPRYTCKYEYHEAVALFFRDSQLQHLSHLKLYNVAIRVDKFQHFVTFLEHHADRLTNLTLTSIILDDPESRQQERFSWPGRLDELRRISMTALSYLELDFFQEKTLFIEAEPERCRYMPVVAFASSSQLQGCDECSSKSWPVTFTDEAPLCGHTVYKNHDGEWPASEEVCVVRKYGR